MGALISAVSMTAFMSSWTVSTHFQIKKHLKVGSRCHSMGGKLSVKYLDSYYIDYGSKRFLSFTHQNSGGFKILFEMQCREYPDSPWIECNSQTNLSSRIKITSRLHQRFENWKLDALVDRARFVCVWCKMKHLNITCHRKVGRLSTNQMIRTSCRPVHVCSWPIGDWPKNAMVIDNKLIFQPCIYEHLRNIFKEMKLIIGAHRCTWQPSGKKRGSRIPTQDYWIILSVKGCHQLGVQNSSSSSSTESISHILPPEMAIFRSLKRSRQYPSSGVQ